jgi:hypothetical protein
MIVDPNMHLAMATPPTEDTHMPIPPARHGSSVRSVPTLPTDTKACWAATPFAIVTGDCAGDRPPPAKAVRLGPTNGFEAPGPLEERAGNAFETVLSAAAPMLAALRRPSLLLPGPLQVVCKAQRIFLQPGEVYEGVWHVDGDDENVVAVVL